MSGAISKTDGNPTKNQIGGKLILATLISQLTRFSVPLHLRPLVELVVASHIDDLRFREHLSGAGQATALFDVTCKDDRVGLLHCCGWRREGMIFEVQVAVDEEAHSYK